jgi:uncharacterized protein
VKTPHLIELEDLIDAIINNNLKRVKHLLQKKIDPNGYLDNAKLRPLHFAAQNNFLEAAQLLIAAGADPAARTEPDQETPLDMAKLHNSKSLIDLLIRCIKGAADSKH